ncbi:MAG: hypothetical protein JSR46_12110 [Verrucomicrobia bacterium]|nr:hypothetical protein [Verrucomicrobiota bacterium]
MEFELFFSEEADEQMDVLEKSNDKKAICKAIKKTLRFMETNLKHPSLNTHPYDSVKGPNNEKIFESYAQNNTPGAYRVFWYYGPKQGQITIFTIIPHPD